MSEFKNKSITTKGMELLTKALAGEKLEFTKIELGNGNFAGDIGEVAQLVGLRQSLPITNITRKGSQVTLSTTLKIEDITTSFDWSEIGVYAKGNDGVEILYMYGYTENTSYISKDSLNEKLIHITVMVSNVADVTAKIDDSLVYLTDEALKEHDMDQEAHGDIRAEVKALEGQLNNIDISWQGIQGKPTTFPPQTHTHSQYISNTGGTITGANGISFNNINGDTGLYAGTKDGATLDGCNLNLRSWYGVGFVNGCSSTSNYNETTVAIDARSGVVIAKGSIRANNQTLYGYGEGYTGNIDTLYMRGVYKLLSPYSGTVPTDQTIATIQHSILEVLGDGSSSGVVIQKLYVTNVSSYSTYANREYRRVRFGSKWSQWKEVGRESMIKSVQRGVFKQEVGSNSTYTINISTINPSKAFVILNGSTCLQSSEYNTDVYLVNLNATSFTIGFDGGKNYYASNVPISWQVIEYM